MAITSPLLEVSIDGARGVLFNITGGKNLGLHEINAAANVIAEVVDPAAEIIFGTAIDARLGDEVQITLIATGFARPVAVSQIPEQYRRQEPDAPTGGNAPHQPEGERAAPIAAVPDPADTELPTFLRRTVAAR
jgi:cell division protein FtsZ